MSKTKSEIKKEIQTIIGDVQGYTGQLTFQIGLHEKLLEGNRDSLDKLDILLGVKERLGVAVPDADAEKIATVGDLVDYVADKLVPTMRWYAKGEKTPQRPCVYGCFDGNHDNFISAAGGEYWTHWHPLSPVPVNSP